jgi:hypothetical protein
MAPAQSKLSSSRAAKTNTPKQKGKARAQPEEPLSGSEAIVAPPKRRGGRQPGSSGYQNEELYTLIELVQKYLPQGQKGWDLVTEEYNSIWTDSKRTANSLKQRWDRVSNMIFYPCASVNAHPYTS